jgi:ligand-binding sensor domain-containing protein
MVPSISIGNDGSIWMATFKGFNRFRNNTWDYPLGSTGSDGVSKVDNSGRLWFKRFPGVSVFDGNSTIHYSTSDGLAGTVVYDIAFDKQGNTWIATGNGGVSCFDGKNWTTYNKDNGLINNLVLSIVIDNDDNKWFATNGGLDRLNANGTIDHITELTSYVEKLCIDLSGNIWAAGENINVYDGNSWTHYEIPERQQDSRIKITSIAVDKNNNIWFGSFLAGVYKFDRVHLPMTRYTTKDGLLSNCINDIEVDAENNVWVATYFGVSQILAQ